MPEEPRDAGWLRWLAIGACLTLLWPALQRAPAPAPARSPQLATDAFPPELTAHGPRFDQPAATPMRARRAASPEVEIARLGAHGPRPVDPVRTRYLRAPDLHRFMEELLPDAAAGERAAQYHLYLTLGQCQTYLRLPPEQVDDLNERMVQILSVRPPGERLAWDNELARCRGFAGANLDALREAMGADLPGSGTTGAENEYASIWFQRALAAGYPPALAEEALRINGRTPAERRALLEEAVASADPDVYWQLYNHSQGGHARAVSGTALAWLIVACRAGHDCSERAEWYRNVVCAQDDADCRPGVSALEHHWLQTAQHEREAAWRLAGRIESAIASGRLQRLPWPALRDRSAEAFSAGP